MSDQQTIDWLRGLAAQGGKGVVNNVDARCLGRIADELESLRFELNDARNEIEIADSQIDRMRGVVRYVPTFDPITINPDPKRAMFPAAPPIAIGAIGANTIQLTIGGVSRVVDGISLCNAVNQCLSDWRRGVAVSRS